MKLTPNHARSRADRPRRPLNANVVRHNDVPAFFAATELPTTSGSQSKEIVHVEHSRKERKGHRAPH
jgi:hypothetical protein